MNKALMKEWSAGAETMKKKKDILFSDILLCVVPYATCYMLDI